MDLRLFANGSLLYCAIDIPQDCLALQEDLDKLFQWIYKWQMSFIVSKCKSLSTMRKSRSLQEVMFGSGGYSKLELEQPY